MDDKFRQLINIPFAGVVVFGRNINDWPPRDVPVVQHSRLVRVLCHQVGLGQLRDAVRFAPLVRLQDGLGGERRERVSQSLD